MAEYRTTHQIVCR